MNIEKFTVTNLTKSFVILSLISVSVAPSLFAQTHRAIPRRKTVSTTGSLLHPPSLHATAPATYDVKFHTTKGDFTVQVTRAWAPNGADRFYNLVEHHFYDNATLFRVVAGFVVQFGIPADPRYGKIWANANIKDDPVKESNLRGYITYAQSSAPNSRSTQVFVNFRDNSRLDSMGFAPFGKVIEGMNVVESFYGGYADQPTGMQDQIANQGNAFLEKNFPKLDKILTARVVPAASAHSVAPHPKPASH